MNHRLVGNKIIHGDIISPDLVIATFSNQFCKEYQKQLVNSLNHGHEILMLYKQYRDNLHITNVLELLEKIEKEYLQWSSNEYQIRRDSIK